VRDESGRVTGVTVAGSDGELTLRARHTISAAGVGSDRLLELATGEPHRVLRPSRACT
jgi:glycerol-3-phosphate dehydrogenase